MNVLTGFLLLMIGATVGYMIGAVFSVNKSAESEREDFEEFQRRYVHKDHSEDAEADL